MTEKEETQYRIDYCKELISAQQSLVDELKKYIDSTGSPIDRARMQIERLEYVQKIKYQSAVQKDWENRLHNDEVKFEAESKECNENYDRVIEFARKLTNQERIKNLLLQLDSNPQFVNQADKNKNYKSFLHEFVNAKIRFK